MVRPSMKSLILLAFLLATAIAADVDAFSIWNKTTVAQGTKAPSANIGNLSVGTSSSNYLATFYPEATESMIFASLEVNGTTLADEWLMEASCGSDCQGAQSLFMLPGSDEKSTAFSAFGKDKTLSVVTLDTSKGTVSKSVTVTLADSISGLTICPLNTMFLLFVETDTKAQGIMFSDSLEITEQYAAFDSQIDSLSCASVPGKDEGFVTYLNNGLNILSLTGTTINEEYTLTGAGNFYSYGMSYNDGKLAVTYSNDKIIKVIFVDTTSDYKVTGSSFGTNDMSFLAMGFTKSGTAVAAYSSNVLANFFATFDADGTWNQAFQVGTKEKLYVSAISTNASSSDNVLVSGMYDESGVLVPAIVNLDLTGTNTKITKWDITVKELTGVTCTKATTPSMASTAKTLTTTAGTVATSKAEWTETNSAGKVVKPDDHPTGDPDSNNSASSLFAGASLLVAAIFAF